MRIGNNPNRGFLKTLLLIVLAVIAFIYVINNPLVKYFVNSFKDNMAKAASGSPNDWQLAAPVVNFK